MRDHPRLRGEYIYFKSRSAHSLGSPPPTRGILLSGEVKYTKKRITPAYAGNTVTNFIIWNDNQDHPRLRGEYLCFSYDCSRYAGSPPPTRGILFSCSCFVDIIRITPAYAGNTYKGVWLKFIDRDHPRLRGEYPP